MKRTDNNQERGIRKFFPVTFVQVSFAIVKIAIVSVVFICIVPLLSAEISQARDVEKVQPANPVALPSTSLKTIIVGNYYPYTFVNDKGIPDGFSVDIAKAVASVMDLKLTISVDTWANAIKALGNGTIDMLPMMAASPERKKIYDFSVPHTISYDAIFARKEVSRVRSLAELVDKTVIVLNKDAAHDYLLSSGMAARMKLILVDSLPDAFRTLAAGKGDAALMPKLVGLIVMKKLNLTNLDPSPVVIEAYNRPFCFAVKQGDQFLLERLSQGLSIIKATGQYQEIYKKWFGALEPPGLSRVTVVKYIAGIVAVSLLIGLGLIIWNVSLRNQVALRTEKLEAEIQEHKRAEEALRESEETYRLVVDNMADVISVMDMNLRFTYVSPSIMRMRGYTAEEAVAQTFEQIVTPESLQIITKTFEEEVKLEASGRADPGRSRIMELEEYRKDGSIVWIENSLSYIRDKAQKPLGIISLSRDITERKQAEEQLKQTLESLRKALGTIIQVMVSAVDARDPYTAGHQVRSANIARAIATEMGLPQETIDGIRMAGSIHDIGKLSIPAEILSKPGKLSAIEFSLIKEHARRGFEMLKDVESPWPLAEIVYQHHERMDGSGYPRNLKGDDIIMEARILAVADVVEAMASHRPYRPGLGIDAALNEIEKNRGIFYDNAVADACLRLFREKGFQL